MKWWVVILNEKIHCVEANSSSNAVFAAMRSAEYYGEGTDSGKIGFSETMKPKGMSKKAFKKMIESAKFV